MSSRRSLRWVAVAGVAAVTAVMLGVPTSTQAQAQPRSAQGPKPKVWTVGTWQGNAGRFSTIQAAVDAASPGDWIAIAPGDYKERGDYSTHKPASMVGAGVWIDKPNLHLLGMSRDGVVVDGTKSGPTCSSAATDQDRGPANSAGRWGRNGIEVHHASGVTIQNLTVCNFLSGADGSGNQI